MLLMVFALTGFWWVLYREPAGVTLKYGELKQVLQDPSVAFQKVKVGHSDVRGEIVMHDAISDSAGSDQRSMVTSFHTSRLGLENDQTLTQLLDKWAPYQGEEEKTLVENLVSILVSCLLIASICFMVFLML